MLEAGKQGSREAGTQGRKGTGNQGRESLAGQLFRQEALDHQGERFWGSSMALRAPALITLTFLLVCLFSCALWFLVQGEYSRKEVVVGAIVANKGEVKVRAPVGGTIEVLGAELGGRVGKGGALLTIQGINNVSDGMDISQQLLAENEFQQKILEQLIEDKRAAYPAKWQQLDSEQHSLIISIAELEDTISNEEQIARLQHSKVVRLSALSYKKHISNADLDLARMENLRQENALQKTRLSLSNSKSQLEQLDHEKYLVMLEYKQQMAELEKGLSELRKQTLQLHSERERQVISPVTGTISVVYSHSGQTVVPRQSLVAITPEDTILEAQLYIPSRSIGFIEPGQEIILRVEAFPFQKFGMLNAHVKEISGSVLLPEESQAVVDMNEPYFKVSAILADQSIQAFGKQFVLRPGMQIKADIVLEKRNLLEWLFEPLFIKGNSR